MSIASMHSKLTRTLSFKSDVSIQQLVQQQRHVLQELEAQKAHFQSQIHQLTEQHNKTQDKIHQRQNDMTLLEANYQTHLRSVRSSDDDPASIATKIGQLRQHIHTLASQLVPFAEPNITAEKLSTLWLNLGRSIQQLGNPLPEHRLLMLVEKFMMDVLVQNLNIHLFPGLTCNQAFVELQQWFDEHDSVYFSTRLRQELSMLVVQHKDKDGGDIQEAWQKSIDRNWSHLYRGLQKAFPTYLCKTSQEDEKARKAAQHYSQQLRELVEEAIELGSVIKGQEVAITAVDVREGNQLFDSQLMEDEDGQTSGTIAFCISPPFVVKIMNTYKPLVKGRVLCFQ
ncbi:hypothetical protein CU098_002420 [Rhizopus stolonifer]|uniref:Uncharacterized protein n=1 Tax=Rhizopus stolonifer TaxID=4846 RepID=A0A367IIU5_RHIST|nr:hypothetical protein CU098_002420 [Rhizopus stolonifer]